MSQQTQSSNQLNEVERQLRSNWVTYQHQILDEFPQVSKADLSGATDIQGLVRRISDRSRLGRKVVRRQLRAITGVQSNQGAQSGQPFGESQTRQFAPSGAGTNFG